MVVFAVFIVGVSQFNSCFTKFVLGTSGGIKFMILFEDFDTGSLIIVRLKYFFCNSDVVNLVWESNNGEVGSIIVNICYLGVL